MSERSRIKRPKRGKQAIVGQFAPRLIEMLRSPAYRALSQSEHRILARLEIELADHGGADNGRLPATYDDFQEYGVHRHAIAPALRALEALGFIEITERGRAGNGEWRRPHQFRLTYRPTKEAGSSDDWRHVETVRAAEKLARAARKQNSSGEERTGTSGENRTTRFHGYGADSATTAHGTDSTTTFDISGGGHECAA
ncbi:hypothetical protein [Ancylobacter sp. SL191]|uniref:hypothetical protein n=1 Tax=Ancylobacter sp. SL191 TaxID=2995166 RepID=UPI00226FDE64|nr:hypothetical protein [Ancylobacter sp. SL191]WAC26263.1 hypothetical protein OU996_14745 [Ancylobacter sp. SL191]